MIAQKCLWTWLLNDDLLYSIFKVKQQKDFRIGGPFILTSPHIKLAKISCSLFNNQAYFFNKEYVYFY